MRFNLSMVISGIVLLIGFLLKESPLWVPATVLFASIIDLFTRQWVSSPRLGSARILSALLKFTFALIGFYAMVGQIVCLGIVIWWIFL